MSKGHDDDIKNFGLPFIPGHELSGIIIEKGSNVNDDKLKIGDRVAVPFILSCGSCAECNIHKPTVCLDQEQPGFTCYGSFAEYVKIDRAERNLRLIPPDVSFVEAAALGCRFTTAYRAVVQQGLGIIEGAGMDSSRCSSRENTAISSWLNRDKTVAVFGCGGLGLSCLMVAKAFQCEGRITTIIAVDISTKALEKAKELGADHTINVKDALYNNDQIREKVFQLTNGLGAEISIDAAGFKATCENALYCTRRACKMIQVGLPIGSKRPEINMGFVAGREIEIIGSHGFAANDLPSLLKLVQLKKLDVKKLIEREVTLKEGAEALMQMDNGSPLGMTMITKFEADVSKL